MTSISLINIGTELLNGRIVNTNATEVGARLKAAGFGLSEILTIPDTRTAIQAAVTDGWSQHDVVLITGGLGPTRDDVTKQVLADWWGQPLEEHAPTLAFIRKRYAERGREMNPLTRAQALAPAGCEVIANPVGTAPGLSFAREGKWLVAMPGVPFELTTMLDEQILPRLLRDYDHEYHLTEVLRLRNVSESEIAMQLADLEDQFPPHLSLAYLPRHDGLWLELRATATEATHPQVKQELTQMAHAMAVRFPERLYARNDRPAPELLGEALLQRDETMAVAESLTGGGLAADIVSVSGASRYFLGSVTAYTIPMKLRLLGLSETLIREHGVVSQEVAAAMATAIREQTGATWSLATTGWAEAPDEQTAPGAWIGLAGPNGVDTEWVRLYYRRQVNIQRVVAAALTFALEKVLMQQGKAADFR